ncbi:MAG: hypothetical protein RMJ59_07700 [Candidatus Nitrosocaldus sp.]|nr:hypothetical protein [Candidatus Nitrosocaldus sp.]MCS7141037.1 hypothetical protein [Candidatus Nitrosocaldus sp.]MDW7999885.1 hypothetical protein [Candidatus Nitrosocaldus sp.]MDW8276243.1 hypothetical protein [Candidatus Nitrosocaldus sp.]
MAGNNRYKDVCVRILMLDPKIRYAGIMNRFGKTLAGSLRKDVRPLFRPEEARDEFFLTAVRESMRERFYDSLGRCRFTLTVHEKVDLVSFLHDGYIVYISLDKGLAYGDVERIVREADVLLSSGLTQ